MKRPLIILAAVTLAAVLVVGILQTSGNDEPARSAPSAAEAQRKLAGAPKALAAIHDDANAMLPVEDFRARLAALKGYPVVVNIWGSWCNPCREEFPIFEQVSVDLGKKVAFLGLATQDSKEAAGAFLAKHPVAYPSYMDFQGKEADAIGLISAPATLFIDPKGNKTYLHQGKYQSAADLERDIARYTRA
jgi:thiol-disulfide isomerase/thioredoxin